MDKKIIKLQKYLKDKGFKKEASLLYLLFTNLFGCRSEYDIEPIYYDAPDCVNVDPSVNFRDMSWNLDNDYPLTYSKFQQNLSGSEFIISETNRTETLRESSLLNMPEKDYREIVVSANSIPMPILNDFIKASGLGTDDEDMYSLYISGGKSDNDLASIAASFFVIEIEGKEYICIGQRHVYQLFVHHLTSSGISDSTMTMNADHLYENGYGDLYRVQDFSETKECSKKYEEWLSKAYKSDLK